MKELCPYNERGAETGQRERKPRLSELTRQKEIDVSFPSIRSGSDSQ